MLHYHSASKRIREKVLNSFGVGGDTLLKFCRHIYQNTLSIHFFKEKTRLSPCLYGLIHTVPSERSSEDGTPARKCEQCDQQGEEHVTFRGRCVELQVEVNFGHHCFRVNQSLSVHACICHEFRMLMLVLHLGLFFPL